jgi:hypothetical protein
VQQVGSGDALPVAAYIKHDDRVAGAAIGGLAGATWVDENRDGQVDGYIYNGQFYPGTPPGYDPTIGGVLAGGSQGGAAVGAVAGAVLPGVSIPAGAIIGAAVPGLAGAVWADRNKDGVVDGYVYNGQYYIGGPAEPPAIQGPERGY